MYQQTWYASINNSNRLETYARFKHEFCYENYLDMVTENKYRKTLTQFRHSSQDLAIERGRYQNIDRQERRISSDKASNLPKRDVNFVLLK